MDKRIIEHFKTHDPILFSVAQKVGPVTLRKSSDYFTTLCESIINQQLSDKAGTTIFKRFKQLFPDQTISPENVLELSNEKMRSVGTSMTKVSYFKQLAQKIVNQELLLETLEDMDNETVIIELTKVKGIGRWTAEMFLMFSLGRPDVFSYGDLGLRHAIQKLYKLEKEPTQKEVEEISQKWSPYRTYACHILWRSNDL